MIEAIRELRIGAAAPGLQEYLVSFPFDLPEEEAIARIKALFEPIIKRRIQGAGVVRIQTDGNTVEAVLQDLAHKIRQL